MQGRICARQTFLKKKSRILAKNVCRPMLSMALSGLTGRKGNMLVSIQPSTDERVLRNLEAVLLIEPNRMDERGDFDADWGTEISKC